MKFPVLENGTIPCPVCDHTILLNSENCPKCNWENILSCLDSDELTVISLENYQEEIEKILVNKGVSKNKIDEFRKAVEKKDNEDSIEEPIYKLTRDISKLKFLSIIQCIFIIIIGLYFINQFYRDNTSIITQLTIDHELSIHPEGERVINMVKSSGYPGKEWIGLGNGLNHICTDSVKWTALFTNNKTVVVEAICDDLNEKPKKLMGKLKSFDNDEKAYLKYHTKLRVQFLIHVDGKEFKIGYKEISFKKKTDSSNLSNLNTVLSNSDFGELIDS